MNAIKSEKLLVASFLDQGLTIFSTRKATSKMILLFRGIYNTHTTQTWKTY